MRPWFNRAYVRHARKQKRNPLRDLDADTTPTTLVISPGGVASSFLIDYLSKFLTLNDIDDRDDIKHLPRLSSEWLSTKKVLYIYGDPDDVYRSIARRGWVDIQGAKLGCVLCQFTFGSLQALMFKKAVQRQIDRFCGYANKRPENVMAISYNDIWAAAPRIKAFFEINDDDFLQNFPPRKERTSLA